MSRSKDGASCNGQVSKNGKLPVQQDNDEEVKQNFTVPKFRKPKFGSRVAPRHIQRRVAKRAARRQVRRKLKDFAKR